MNYKEKYFKYKLKYLSLKNNLISGGGDISEEADPALAESLFLFKIRKDVTELQNVEKIDDKTFDKAITDTKAEIEKLKNMGHSEEAAELEEMLEVTKMNRIYHYGTQPDEPKKDIDPIRHGLSLTASHAQEKCR